MERQRAEGRLRRSEDRRDARHTQLANTNATAAYMQQRYGGNAASEYRSSPQNFRGDVARTAAQATAASQTVPQYLATRNALMNDAAVRQATLDTGRGNYLAGRGAADAPAYDYGARIFESQAGYDSALADAQARREAAMYEAQGGIEQQRIRSMGDLGVAEMQYAGVGPERLSNAYRNYTEADLADLDAGRFGAQLPGGGTYLGRGETHSPRITAIGPYDAAFDPSGRMVARGNSAYFGSPAHIEAMMPEIAAMHPQEEGESDDAYADRLAALANDLLGIDAEKE
jgi:hypothetical protein